MDYAGNPFYTYPEEGLDIFESNGKVVLKVRLM